MRGNSYQIRTSETTDMGRDWISTDMGEEQSGDISTDMGGQASFQAQTEAQIQGAADSLSQVESLRPETWQQLDARERLAVLLDIENRMATVQGRPTVSVRAQPMPPGVFGGYTHGEGITVSEEHLASDDIRELVDSIVHEGRHAYQDHALQTPGFVSDANLVETWRNNWENYLTAEEYGQELYESQPIEHDAWQYAARITETLFGPKG